MDAGLPDKADRMIVTTRVFDAPPALVFDAFTDPDHLARWWGPNGFTLTTHSFDFREGGVWRFIMHGPDGRDYPNRITFDEIDRPKRLAYRHSGEGDYEGIKFQNLITFEDLGGRTKLTMSALFPSAAERDRVAREHHADEGGKQTLGRLGEYIDADLFVITRKLKAPRDLVWKMYTELEHLKHWWGPKGFEWVHGSLDLKPGGLFHYGMKGPNGDVMWGRFVYQEIVAPERLCFITSFSDAQGSITRAPFALDWPLEVFNVAAFTQEADGTRITLRGAPVNASAAEHEKFRSWKPSMQAGFSGTFEQLERYLEEVGK